MPHYPLQDACLAVIIGTPLLAGIFVGLRIYARKRLSSYLGWDDYTVMAALVLSLALIYPSIRFTKMWHFGIHIWNVDSKHLEPDYDEYHIILLTFNLLNTLIVPLVKASIIILLLRVSKVIPAIRNALYVMFVFNAGACIIPWFIFIFQCPPLTGNNWKPRVFGSLHCMGRMRIGQMTIFLTCANLLTDLLIFPIPVLLMRKLERTSIRTRVIITFLFATSLGVTAIGAAKIYLTYNDRLYRSYDNDWTYTINFCVSHAENNVAIIVACIPALRGLIVRWISGATQHGYDSSVRSPVSPGRQQDWPSDRIKREWDISITTMTQSTATTRTPGRSMNDSAIRSIGSDTTLGKDTYVAIAEVERGYGLSNPTLKEIDDMEFITVKSGILDRNSAEGRAASVGGVADSIGTTLAGDHHSSMEREREILVVR